jgi:hypothetical protein
MDQQRPERQSTTPDNATRARSYAPVARSNSTDSLEQRVSATRWKSDELTSLIPTAPTFEHGWLSDDLLNGIVREFEAITGERVGTVKKRRTIAACYRIHGEDLLSFVADFVRFEGSSQNLLGVLRNAEPRHRSDDEARPADTVVVLDDVPPIATSGTFEHTGIPCPVEGCLPGVIYCSAHRPPYDPRSGRRYDRDPSSAEAPTSFDAAVDDR